MNNFPNDETFETVCIFFFMPIKIYGVNITRKFHEIFPISITIYIETKAVLLHSYDLQESLFNNCVTKMNIGHRHVTVAHISEYCIDIHTIHVSYKVLLECV